MLSDAELGAIRQQVLRSLPDTVTVERLDPLTYQWVTVGQWPCRLIPRRTTQRTSGGEPEGVTLWHVLMPHDADVRVGDRLVVGSALYTVTGSDRGRSEAPALIVQCSPLG